MQRHSASTDCARPLCAIRATVRFWFDGESRRVVLDRRISEWGGQGLLCENHADRLIVARGWELDDRRVSEPRLFSVEQADRAAARRIRRLSHPEAHPSTPLPLDGGPLYTLPSDYESPPAAPLAPMPTGKVMPTTGPAVSAARPDPAARPEKNDHHDLGDHDGHYDNNLSDQRDQSDQEPDQNRDDDHDQHGDFNDRADQDRKQDAKRDRGDRSGRPSELTPLRDTQSRELSAPQTKSVSARPKRRAHTDGNTPLLTRAFDAAASRVRPSSTMESLIPRTPPLPEPPHFKSSSSAWPTVRFT